MRKKRGSKFQVYLLDKFHEKFLKSCSDDGGVCVLSRKSAKSILGIYHIPRKMKGVVLDEMEEAGLIKRKNKQSLVLLQAKQE